MDYRSLLKNVEKTLSAIDGGDDVVSTVAAVGEAVVGNFRAELGIIGGRLYLREDNDYVLKRGFGRSRKVPEGLTVPMSYGPIHRALDEGVVLADLKDPSVDRELEARLGVTRFAAVSFGDGAFILSFDVHPRVAADDLLVSLGIIRTVLDSKVRSERLESLLEEARRIQQSILPRSLPEIGDYEVWAVSEPAEAVGGDFYDFIPLTPDSFGAAIADASGHGLLAALLVRDVYVGLRMGIGGDLKIARAVERLNRILNKSRLATKFVSLFYGELEANGEIIYVNAGHPGPLHLHARTRSFSEMESTGMVLGPSPNATYGRRAAKLEPGDLLLLYTDGIVEAHDHRGREFGLDRIRRILLDYRKRSARETAEKLLTSVREFSAGRPAEDDRTVVVIRRTGKLRSVPGPAGGASPPAVPPILG
jgi:sigma-B regulation protein RsbU (phosphoserine phosphatase)